MWDVIIIIIPVFTLGSIYSTHASGVKQITETINSNKVKNNRVKNPKRLEANQLAINFNTHRT